MSHSPSRKRRKSPIDRIPQLASMRHFGVRIQKAQWQGIQELSRPSPRNDPDSATFTSCDGRAELRVGNPYPDRESSTSATSFDSLASRTPSPTQPATFAIQEYSTAIVDLHARTQRTGDIG